MIEVKNVCLTLQKNQILKDVSVHFERGKIHGLIGRNGSGKTMLMKCICGFVKPSSGDIFVDKLLIGKDCDFPRNTGIIIETPGFIPYYSGLKNLKLLVALRGKISAEEIKSTMEKVGLDPELKRHVRKYSLRKRYLITSYIFKGKIRQDVRDFFPWNLRRNIMLKISKILVSAALAVSLTAGLTVSASADTYDFYEPVASHNWNVRSVGGGAPGSANRSERFYLYYSSGGANGNCDPISTDDTTFGVRLSCVDGIHTINYYPMTEDMFGKYIVWNREGYKKWTYSDNNGEAVHYKVEAYGLHTYSTGVVTRA